MLVAIAVASVLVIPSHAANFTVNKNIVLHDKYGQLTVANVQQYQMFVIYANGTMFFNYTGLEDHVGHFLFTVQSYGNGTLDLRFKGAIPTVVAQTNAASSTYVKVGTYQEITYTTSQTSSLNIQFFTNPRFSLSDGALAGSAAIVAVIVIRTAYVVTAKDTEERLKLVNENKKIFIICGIMLVVLLFGAALFP